MIEDIEVLVVVPVGVAHDDDVDVPRGQAALLQRIEQEDAAAYVAAVDQGPFLAGDQHDAAPSREAGLRGDVRPPEDDVDLGHYMPLVRSRSSCWTSPITGWISSWFLNL